jgi:hypothetical protein
LPVRGKKNGFSMERPGKNSFCRAENKPPGKNPAKLALQTFSRWKKLIFDRQLISK